eukprot:Em0002g246a
MTSTTSTLDAAAEDSFFDDDDHDDMQNESESLAHVPVGVQQTATCNWEQLVIDLGKKLTQLLSCRLQNVVAATLVRDRAPPPAVDQNVRSLSSERRHSGVVPREGVSGRGETQHQLALVDQDYPKNRMNDGKCDARGRLWCGTMVMRSLQGNLCPAKELCAATMESHTR